jgi:elongation factor G
MRSTPPARPILSVTLLPGIDQWERLWAALAELRRHNPILRVKSIMETGPIEVQERTEARLQEICRRLREDFHLDFDTGAFRVLYIERIRREAHGAGKYIRQAGGSGNYGHAEIRLEPADPGMNFQFHNEMRPGSLAGEFVQAVSQGIQAAAEGGIVAGFEVVDFRATLCGGSWRESDSNEMAFRVAGSMAFKDAARRANPVALEPMMFVEILSPPDRVGAITADLSAGRGRVEKIQDVHRSQRIEAIVPLESMLGYDERLRSLTQGGASCRMDFDHYAEVRRSGPSGGDAAGAPTMLPRGRGPRVGSDSADPDEDWT